MDFSKLTLDKGFLNAFDPFFILLFSLLCHRDNVNPKFCNESRRAQDNLLKYKWINGI